MTTIIAAQIAEEFLSIYEAIQLYGWRGVLMLCAVIAVLILRKAANEFMEDLAEQRSEQMALRQSFERAELEREKQEFENKHQTQQLFLKSVEQMQSRLKALEEANVISQRIMERDQQRQDEFESERREDRVLNRKLLFKISDLQEQVAQQRQHHQDEKTAYTEENKQLQQRIQELETTIEKHEQRIAKLASLVNSLTESNEKIIEERNTLKEQMVQERRKRLAAQKEVQRLTMRVNQLNEQQRQMKQEIENGNAA